MLLFLIGLPGVGKTTVGKQLATSLSLPFVDLDDLVVHKEQMSITALIQQKGETYFRQSEHEVVHSLLAKKELVVACGGGTPCFFDHLEVMKRAGKVVYLTDELDAIWQRLQGEIASRPLFKNRTLDELKDLLAHRAQWYEQAHLTVSVQDPELASRIRSLLVSEGDC